MSINLGLKRNKRRIGKCVRKDGALWSIEGLPIVPECGGLGCSKKKEREEGEEKADDDAVEHPARARVTLD